MDERRQIKRRQLVFQLEVVHQHTGQLFGRLLDITPHGMQVITTQPIALGEVMSLRILLATELFNKKSLDFDAKLVWKRPDLNPKYHLCGFQFKEVSQANTSIIMGLIIDQSVPE